MWAAVRVLVAIAALAGGVGLMIVHLGCTATVPPGPSTVRGRVTFQALPLAGALVVFTPDRDRGTSGKPIRAETGPDGSFQLQLDGNPTIPAGWYRVAIAPPPGAAASGRPAFPQQLRRPDASSIVREVANGQEHFFEFAVEVPNG